MGKGNPIIKRAVTREQKAIGDLTSNYMKRSLRGQQHQSIAPINAAGDISLAFYRGEHLGRDEAREECIYILKKKFPEAAKYLKTYFKGLKA